MTVSLKDQTVLVVGLGKSGLAAARVLVAKGARVIVNDSRDDKTLGARADEARALGAELSLGGHPEALFTSVDQIVVSPGVPSLPALDAAERAGVPIASEVELASWFVSSTVIAITGTNGKSTVTTLIGEMAMRSGRPAFVGGNLGTPLVDVIDTPAASGDGLVVVELSSYQLERVERFRAHVALLLNVSPDHLNRYESYADYVAAKGNIFVGQRAEDAAIVFAKDDVCSAMGRSSKAALHALGTPGSVFIEDGEIRHASGFAFPVSDLRIAGRHNVDNACAAVLAALVVGIRHEDIAHVLREFKGLPHRMEHVRELSGVHYYDDSKATNVGAAVAALDGLRGAGGKVVLIAGGRHKGSSYEPLADAMRTMGRSAVLVGESSSLIATALDEVVPCEIVEDYTRATQRARDHARSGDFVVLAPACSSFDLFKSYAERGDVFQDAVRRLS